MDNFRALIKLRSSDQN